MTKPLQQIAIAMVQRDGRWLVARRKPDVHLGGLWEFPGGKRDGDETSIATALRELQEECGVIGDAERVLDTVICEHDDRILHITPVVCRWRAGEAQPMDSAECRWVSVEELLGLDMPAINEGIVRAALRV